MYLAAGIDAAYRRSPMRRALWLALLFVAHASDVAQPSIISRCDMAAANRATTGARLRVVCVVELDSVRALIARRLPRLIDSAAPSEARVGVYFNSRFSHHHFVPGTIDLGPTSAQDSVVPVVVRGTWRADRERLDS